MTRHIGYIHGSKLEPFSPPVFCCSGVGLEKHLDYRTNVLFTNAPEPGRVSLEAVHGGSSRAQYLSGPDRTAQILGESAIVARAIARHRREAALQGRTKEVREMEALYFGVSRMALELTQPNQLSTAA